MTGHELAMSLRAAYLAMHRRTNALFASAGVTADQFVVLAALAEANALTQRDLVSRTSSDPNTLRAMLVLMERQGIVERRPHPTDGRARSVSLTRSGRAVFARLWRKSQSLRDRLLAEFEPAAVESLAAQLRRIASVLDAQRTNSPRKAGALAIDDC